MRTGSGLFTDSAASPYAGTTPGVVRPAKPSRHTRVYSGTSPKPAIADEAETHLHNSLTSDFLFTLILLADTSIFARLKSFIRSPCTISHCSVADTGGPEKTEKRSGTFGGHSTSLNDRKSKAHTFHSEAIAEWLVSGRVRGGCSCSN